MSQFLTCHSQSILPATTAEDDEKNDENEQNTAGDADDDGQLLLVQGQDASHTARGVEGEGDFHLAHAAVVDRHTGVGAQVARGHPCYRQAVVEFDPTLENRICFVICSCCASSTYLPS